MNQEQQRHQHSFREEYHELLLENEIKFEDTESSNFTIASNKVVPMKLFYLSFFDLSGKRQFAPLSNTPPDIRFVVPC